jgi:hypothetical protein
MFGEWMTKGRDKATTHLLIQTYRLAEVERVGRRAQSLAEQAAGPVDFVDFVGCSDPILNQTS